MPRLSEKVAIVTGGASGMGAATARLFVAEGATVIVGDVRQPQSDFTPKDGAKFCKLDVTAEEDWRRVVDDALQAFGRIDILVNNAGICSPKPIAKETKAGFQRHLDVNIVGAFLGVQAVAPAMIEAKRGSIINVSSTEGMRGTAGLTAYGASKWAIRGFSKSCAVELGGYGIRVNSVHPGLIDTPMANPEKLSFAELNADARFQRSLKAQAISRAGAADEVAQVTLFLATDEASYVTGAEILVDGGMLAGAKTVNFA